MAKGDKTFTQDVGTVQFPDRNFSRPLAVDPTELVKTVSETGLALYADKVSRDLEGEDIEPGPPNDPTQQTSGMGAITPDVDKELNLSRIARMRQQGIITSSGAKIMASRAVQEASARLPGMSSKFRQQAAAYFGDFGPGVNLLDETAAEKESQHQQRLLDDIAIKNGLFILGPDGSPRVTNEHRDVVRKTSLKLYQIDLDTKSIEHEFKQGEYTAAKANSVAMNYAHTETMGLMGTINAHITNTGAVMKPEEILPRIAAAKEGAKAKALKGLDGAIVDQAKLGTINSNIDNYFKSTEEYLKSESFSTLVKDKRDALLHFAEIQGAKAFPLLTMAERAAPGVGAKFIVESLEKFSRMNPEQLASWRKNDPMAAMVMDFKDRSKVLIDGLDNVTKGLLPDKLSNPEAYDATLLSATSIAVDKSTTVPPETKQKGVDVLIKAAGAGDRQSIYVMGDPRVAANTTPEQRKQLVHSIAGETAKVVYSLPGLLATSRTSSTEEADFDGVITYTGKSFVFNPLKSKEVKDNSLLGIGISPQNVPVMQSTAEIANALKTLNAVAKVLHTYETSPEFENALGGKTPDEYLSGLLMDVTTTAKEHVKQTEKKKKEIESGKIDTWRGATPKESVMPRADVPNLSAEENADINAQIAALQKRQVELEAMARKLGATEEDLANTGPLRGK